jgi:hypothetical protein
MKRIIERNARGEYHVRREDGSYIPSRYIDDQIAGHPRAFETRWGARRAARRDLRYYEYLAAVAAEQGDVEVVTL